MSRAARLWSLSSWLGVGTLALGVVLTLLLPGDRSGLPDGFVTPIVALEFAGSEADVRAVVEARGDSQETGERAGVPADAERANDGARMRAFDLGNQLDFVFLLVYGAFLFSAALAIVQGSPPAGHDRATRRARLVLPLAVVASAADAYENLQLLSLTAAVREGGDMDVALERLAVATWIKWGSLLLAFYMLAPWLFRRGRVGKVVVLMTAVGIVAAALTPMYRGVAHEVMANAVFAMFLGLLVVAFQARRVSRR